MHGGQPSQVRPSRGRRSRTASPSRLVAVGGQASGLGLLRALRSFVRGWRLSRKRFIEMSQRQRDLKKDIDLCIRLLPGRPNLSREWGSFLRVGALRRCFARAKYTDGDTLQSLVGCKSDVWDKQAGRVKSREVRNLSTVGKTPSNLTS